MSQAYPESTLSNAVTQPVSSPAQLTAWWCPYMEDGFYPFKVEVVSRDQGSGSHVLKFKLVGDLVPLPDRDTVYEIDLMIPGTAVWPVLPSTAQLCKEGDFGFLLLGASFGVDTSWAEEDKWPIGQGTK
jgi:hypothetical protein